MGYDVGSSWRGVGGGACGPTSHGTPVIRSTVHVCERVCIGRNPLLWLGNVMTRLFWNTSTYCTPQCPLWPTNLDGFFGYLTMEI